MKQKHKNGWLMMPLVKNIPESVKGWTRTTCPECGQPCWKRRWDKKTIKDMRLLGAICTDCADKKGVWKDYE